MNNSKFNALFPDDDRLSPEEIAAIKKALAKIDSTALHSADRMNALLDDPMFGWEHSWRTFFPIFQEIWPGQAIPWASQEKLLDILQTNHAERAWGWIIPADNFPEVAQVYRGGSFWRVQGVSWTLNRKVAESFARGHRDIQPVRPVIASTLIRREDIFAYFTDRGEDEVVLDPTMLTSISFQEWFEPEASVSRNEEVA